MWHGYHIWNYHIMNLINQIGITPFIIVDYSELLGMNYINELKIIKTFFSLRLSDHDLENIYEIAVDKNLRHHKTSDELGVPRRTRELWDKVLSMKVLSPDRQVVLDK